MGSQFGPEVREGGREGNGLPLPPDRTAHDVKPMCKLYENISPNIFMMTSDID